MKHQNDSCGKRANKTEVIKILSKLIFGFMVILAVGFIAYAALFTTMWFF